MALKSEKSGATSGTSEKLPTNSAMDESSMIQATLAAPTLELEHNGMFYGGMKVAHRQMCGLHLVLQRLGRKNGSS